MIWLLGCVSVVYDLGDVTGAIVYERGHIFIITYNKSVHHDTKNADNVN